MSSGEEGQFGSSGGENPYAAPEASAEPEPTHAGDGALSERMQGGASVGEVFEAFGKIAAESAESGVLWLVVGFQIVMAGVSQLPAMFVDPNNPGALSSQDMGMMGLSYMVVLLVGSVGMILQRPLRKVYFEGAEVYGGLGDVISDAMSRLGTAAGFIFAYTLIVILGLVACIVPGIVAAIGLVPGYYLAVASDDLAVTDVVTEAWDLFRRHWASIIGAGLVYLVVAVVVLAPVYGTLMVTDGLTTIPGQMAINLLSGIFAILFYVALIARVEVADRKGRHRAVWSRISLPAPDESAAGSGADAAPGAESDDGAAGGGGSGRSDIEW